MVRDSFTLKKLLSVACGKDQKKCKCKIVVEAGQTDLVPIETTKIVCERKIYPTE